MSSSTPASETSGLEPGQALGEWQIVRRLGEGGFGAVYEAVQPLIGKSVAVKVLDLAHVQHPQLIERFTREAKAVNRIAHPNIVNIFAFGTLDDGRPYFVMDLVQGESLADRLKRGPLALQEVKRVLLDVLLALEAAHAAHIVHRDLKPANIMLTSGQPLLRAILLDFGIAKLTESNEPGSLQTATGALLGTPAYMSPEQCMGPDVDPSSDVYSLGVVLFEMLTGQRPFQEATPAQLIVAHLHKTPAPPSFLQPLLPTSVDRLVLQMLAKDPARRPRLGQIVEWCRAPDEATPGKSAPGKAAPGKAAPGKSAPGKSAPGKATPPAPRPDRTAWAVGIGLATAVSVVGLTLWVRGPEPAPIAPPRASTEPEVRPVPAAQLIPAPQAEPEATIPARPDLGAAAPTPALAKTPAPAAGRPSLSPAASTPPEPRAAREAQPEPRSAAPRPAPRRAAADEASGFLTLTTAPWTQVTLDDRAVGTTPLYKLPVSPGRHRLRLRNPGLGIDVTREVVVTAAQTTKAKYDFGAQ